MTIAPVPPRATVPVRSAEDDSEYRRNYVSFEHVRALYALDQGWTGKGVLVGVADDGVVENDELRGQLSPLSRDFGNVTTDGQTRQRNVVGDAFSDHGTLVASVIAGRNDGVGIQGIAPGASIVALRVSDVDTNTKEETLGRTLPAALDYAGQNGVKVVNLSLAKEDANKPSPTWANMVARYAARGGLLVNSAGNDSEPNPKGYLDLNDANREGWLFVVALAETSSGLTIADYSNRCGTVAMARCVSAMGSNATMDANGNPVLFSGTSSAAPQVSGLAALILGKWPQLTGVQAGQVILNTARDIGEAGIDAVYGAGLIDVQAALAPASPALSNGTAKTALAGSSMIVPDALGGSVTGAAIKTMLGNVTVLDEYGRDYSGSLAGFIAHPERRAGALARQVAASAGAGATQFAANGLSARLGYATARSGPNPQDQRTWMTGAEISADLGRTRLLATYAAQDAIQDEAMGLAPASDVTLAYAPGANLAFGVERPVAGGKLTASMLASNAVYGSAQGVMLGWRASSVQVKAGYLEEQGTLFGTPLGTGALRLGDGARTAFVELSRRWDLRGWSLDAYASVGATRLRIGADTLLTSSSALMTQRAGLSASRLGLGGRMRLGVALPLVAFAGRGELTYASAYDLASQSLVFRRDRVALTGQADPVFSLGYERILSGSALRFAAATDTGVDDVRLLVSWSVRTR